MLSGGDGGHVLRMGVLISLLLNYFIKIGPTGARLIILYEIKMLFVY